MIGCPGCGADMRFAPEKQMLVCDYCGQEQDPVTYEQQNGMQAKDSEYFETVVFTCPQCGGDILSTDDTAATFCSYCGASVMLSARVSKEKRPDYLIPFQIGKEGCIAAYKKAIGKAIYAPKALRMDSEIEKFRGIYMPYWSYTMNVDSVVSAKGEESHRDGDYIVTKEYNVSAPVKGDYEGISYDSASSFSDNLSQGIAPFDMKDVKPFSPAYMSGFYADNGDVEGTVYQADAQEVVKDHVGDCLSKTTEFKKFSISSSEISKNVKVNMKESKRALYPVWFLSNRTGERISYAVVNGQTGKLAADIPVDPVKYIIGSAILLIPLFILLNMVFTLTPGTTMFVAMILNIISIIFASFQISSLNKRETGEDDKGIMSLQKKDKKAQKDDSKPKAFSYKKLTKQFIALLIGIIVWFWSPVNDIYYYSAVAIVIVVTCISFIDIIKYYNLLTTRKLPQLGARGGDEDAE